MRLAFAKPFIILAFLQKRKLKFLCLYVIEATLQIRISIIFAFQLATYPRLCEETERIVAGYIREREEKTKDQVRIHTSSTFRETYERSYYTKSKITNDVFCSSSLYLRIG